MAVQVNNEGVRVQHKDQIIEIDVSIGWELFLEAIESIKDYFGYLFKGAPAPVRRRQPERKEPTLH